MNKWEPEEVHCKIVCKEGARPLDVGTQGAGCKRLPNLEQLKASTRHWTRLRKAEARLAGPSGGVGHFLVRRHGGVHWEIEDSLAEAEEKYEKAMVSSAQLDKEKMNCRRQVDTLKDTLPEPEEQLAESRQRCEEKSKGFQQEKHTHCLPQFQSAQVKAAPQQREEMLEKQGIILNSETATNGETSDTLKSVGYPGPTKMTKEELNALKATGTGP
ncbi:hypothetical protein QTO34_007939 [Cnephaeus nilssonii]|uniref:Uncharacterized protein n=1 Tax=Cnephaeus nilssonii TaxID=3371016 RepID=A0AA40LVR2_CNENI|nr:hypothetical protein QTO34_007939 [Eptesicus nilssonii]